MSKSPTTCDYLEEAAEYCERRPWPIEQIQLNVTRLGVFLRWEGRFHQGNLGCGRYVCFRTLELAKENPIVAQAKFMEEEIMADLRKKDWILEKERT